MKIAYTTGDFDILNESHFELFNIIQKYGYENIIVGLLTDEYLSYDKIRVYLEKKYRLIKNASLHKSVRIENYKTKNISKY